MGGTGASHDTTDSLEPHSPRKDLVCKEEPHNLAHGTLPFPKHDLKIPSSVSRTLQNFIFNTILFFMFCMLMSILQKCKIKLTLASTSLSEKQFVNTDFDSA